MDDDGGYIARIRLEPLTNRANKLVKNGRFDEAERLYRQVLAGYATHKWAKKQLGRLKKVGVWMRRLERDADATGTRFKLMKLLYNLNAFEACLAQIAELKKHKYGGKAVDLHKAYVAVRQKRFGDALAYFDKRLKEDKTSKNIKSWQRYTKAKKQLKDSPKNFKANMTLAQINIDDKSYSSARDNFYAAMDVAATKAEFDAAKDGVQLISLLRESDKLKKWALGDIGDHKVKRAKRRIRRVLEISTKTKKGEQRANLRDALYKEFASKARDVYERKLAIWLLKQRTREFPKNRRAWYSLAWTAYYFGDVETAEYAAGRSLAIKPDFVDGNHLKSLVLARLGDYDRALKFSKRAATHKTYSWPRLLQARIAAAKGDTAKAMRLAKKAHSMNTTSSDMRTGVNATIRLHKATKALAGKKLKKKARNVQILKVVRSLVQLKLPREALKKLVLLRKDKALHREGAWAILKDTDLPLRQRIEAAEQVKFKAPYRQMVVDQAKAASAVALDPTRERRSALASTQIALGEFHQALAALGFLIDRRTDHSVQQLVGKARAGLRAGSLKNAADAASGRGAFPTAAKLAKRAAQAYADLGYTNGDLNARFRWAAALSGIPRREEALVVIHEGLKRAKMFGQPNHIIDFDRIKAFILSATGKLDAVSKALLKARAKCAAADNEYCLATITRELGGLAMDEGRHTDAESYARDSLKWSHQVGDPNLQRQALAMLADVYMVSGQLTEADKRSKVLLAKARKAVDYHHERFALMVRGAVAMKRGKSKEAYGFFKEAYRVGVQTGNPHHRAQARRFMGALHLWVDKDFAKAAERFGEAARLYRANDALLETADAEMGIARAKAKLGKIKEARSAYAAALKIARKMDRRPMQAGILSASAILESDDGKPKPALLAARKGLGTLAGDGHHRGGDQAARYAGRHRR